MLSRIPTPQLGRSRAAQALMVLSGFAGLAYQIIWSQQAAHWLGHESSAVLAVVSALFGGLALGAIGAVPFIERSAQPLRWYAACEALVAVWAAVLALGMQPISEALLNIIGAQPSAAWQWSVAFAGSLLLLLPASAAMGASLPAMARWAALQVNKGSAANDGPVAANAKADSSAAAVAALYGANTFGAVLGVLATAFWLVPMFGLTHTAIFCALLNLLCAAMALKLSLSSSLSLSLSSLQRAAAARRPQARTRFAHQTRPPLPALAVLAATGFIGIGYEVLVVRVISQTTENTVFTFAMLLAVYLLGTAAGAAAYAKGWLGAVGVPEPASQRDRLLMWLTGSYLFSGAALWWAPAVHSGVLTTAGATIGAGMASALLSEAVLVVLAFAAPTFFMGALFSHLVTQAFRTRAAGGVGFGQALAANTLGAALALALVGVWMLPALGAKAAMLLLAAAYLALLTAPAWRQLKPWLAAAALLALFIWAPPLVFVDVPEGGRIVRFEEGALGAVSVVQDADGVKRLRINNRQQEGSSATQFADARQALLPVLLHPAPRRVLFLGLGTGTTAAAAAAEAGVQVDAVELLPEVIRASALFVDVPAANAATSPRLTMLAADARRFVRASPLRYDVIVSDNFHPARSGSALLYTVEHFLAVRARLNAEGVFCQWLPLHQLDMPSLRSIVRSFLMANPNAWAVLATNSLQTPVLGLVTRAAPGGFDLELVRQRIAAYKPQDPQGAPLAAFGITDDLSLMGSFVADTPALKRLAADAPLNTDDRPVVAYLAPRITYAPDSTPAERLLELLPTLSVSASALFSGVASTPWIQRWVAYGNARNLYLKGGEHVRPAADVKGMLGQVREPLLQVLRTSADFAPAYEPLLGMAQALAQDSPREAQALLQELARVAPARGQAAAALAAMPHLPP